MEIQLIAKTPAIVRHRHAISKGHVFRERNQVENKKQRPDPSMWKHCCRSCREARLKHSQRSIGDDETTMETPGTNSRYIHHDRVVRTGLIKISFQPDFVPMRLVTLRIDVFRPDEKRRTINWHWNSWQIHDLPWLRHHPRLTSVRWIPETFAVSPIRDDLAWLNLDRNSI